MSVNNTMAVILAAGKGTRMRSAPRNKVCLPIDGKPAVNRAIDAGKLPDYLAANHAFHFALYAAADAPVLLDLARSLWLRAGPSLRAVIDRFGREVAPDLHREAISAMRVGDATGLARAIERDIQQGVDHVRQALAEGH